MKHGSHSLSASNRSASSGVPSSLHHYPLQPARDAARSRRRLSSLTQDEPLLDANPVATGFFSPHRSSSLHAAPRFIFRDTWPPPVDALGPVVVWTGRHPTLRPKQRIGGCLQSTPPPSLRPLQDRTPVIATDLLDGSNLPNFCASTYFWYGVLRVTLTCILFHFEHSSQALQFLINCLHHRTTIFVF
jgi:hypothetical protein